MGGKTAWGPQTVDMYVYDGLGAAVQALHTAHGRVVVRAEVGGPPNRPANFGWCGAVGTTAACQALRAAEQMHGAGSPPARAARQAYRVATGSGERFRLVLPFYLPGQGSSGVRVQGGTWGG